MELQETGHPRLPFMGSDGCIVAPHLRPICTVHTCDINSLGFKKGDPDWTKRYFALRAKLERREAKISIGLDDLINEGGK